MKIRCFEVGDEIDLLFVFLSAVHETASQSYTEEQVNAWAPADIDISAWCRHMRLLKPYIAIIDDEIVGYADLQLNGYIDHFFVASKYVRQGVGMQLIQHIFSEARKLGIEVLTSDVSKTAEPFFLHNGFEVVVRNCPVKRGIVVENALMKRSSV